MLELTYSDLQHFLRVIMSMLVVALIVVAMIVVAVPVIAAADTSRPNQVTTLPSVAVSIAVLLVSEHRLH